ncbi:maltoporin [Enterovibrio paralichthyis]|uniref:maltoporin n=1 Tax=Enterovibrio paralichthyis TaxID=2853805 RepID=UPI001C44FF48|nr:carbohydrate porin [Enterovibrio paralichthyis]MBV7299810.1 carbohydrate porin [Enterovibrio paralichthyis]
MKKLNYLALAVACAISSTAVSAVEFTGYARAGTAISGDGSGDQSFAKNALGRLGNEGDNYYEFGFVQMLQEGEQNWQLTAMLSKGDDGISSWETDVSDGDDSVNVPQFYVTASGLFESAPEAVLWGGKRFYQRKDVHITDFFFLNNSGTGGGIENIPVGEQKLSLAFIQDGKTDNSTGYLVDARLADIPLWDNATLELIGVYNFATEQDEKDEVSDDGIFVTAVVHQNLENGFNQTAFQYGTAGYGDQLANFGQGPGYARGNSAQNEASGFRIINWGVVSFGDAWEMGHQLSYHRGIDLINGKGDSDLFSVVVRPMYKWSDTQRTIAEAGYFSKTQDGEQDQGGSKFTLAQAWAMGDGFWARPEIRLYGSYITDRDGDTFGSKGDSEFVTGVQMEVWF